VGEAPTTARSDGHFFNRGIVIASIQLRRINLLSFKKDQRAFTRAAALARLVPSE
jgi:hypothetical protein